MALSDSLPQINLGVQDAIGDNMSGCQEFTKVRIMVIVKTGRSALPVACHLGCSDFTVRRYWKPVAKRGVLYMATKLRSPRETNN
ncbi:hypothetical protein TNCV_2263721 [Trichonephila clavipes]|nr:hypothetical protein TNCV_2263721 [Trichonephila clavipes]